MKKIAWSLPAAIAAALTASASAAGAQVTDRHVEAGLGLLPAEARAGAEVQIEAESGWVVRRHGDNGWTCRISLPQDRLAAKCFHSILTGKIALETKLYADGLSGEQTRQHMAVALHDGTLSIPPGSVEVTGSGALEDGQQIPVTMSGYYFVYFPFETAKTMGMPAEDPGEGRPWLHHGGTADAHLMWRRSHSPGK